MVKMINYTSAISIIHILNSYYNVPWHEHKQLFHKYTFLTVPGYHKLYRFVLQVFATLGIINLKSKT